MAISPAGKAPRAWEMLGRADDPHLRLGQRVVRLRDIAEIRADDRLDRHIGGLIASCNVFLAIACMCCVGVVEFGWRTRFLLAAVACLLLGATSLMQLAGKPAARLYRLRFVFRSGATVLWSTPDQRAMAELKADRKSVV